LLCGSYSFQPELDLTQLQRAKAAAHNN